MSERTTDLYEQFATRAREYDVTVTRTAAAEATDAIAEAIETPAMGAPLPWDDVDLPDEVQTDPTPSELEAATTGISAAGLAVADYGSVLLQPTPAGDEPVSLFPDLHVAVVRADDVVPDMEATFEWLGETIRETGGSAILATGPSATADMGALVQGAHGPKNVHVIVVT